MLPALIHLKSKSTACGCQWNDDDKKTNASEEGNDADNALSNESDSEEGEDGKDGEDVKERK